jgi:hypothetical protein
MKFQPELMHHIDILQLKFHAIWSTTTSDMRITSKNCLFNKIKSKHYKNSTQLVCLIFLLARACHHKINTTGITIFELL